MKWLIGCVLAWLMYYAGDWLYELTSVVNMDDWAYPLINWLLIRSGDVQDWGGVKWGPWKKPDVWSDSGDDDHSIGV